MDQKDDSDFLNRVAFGEQYLYDEVYKDSINNIDHNENEFMISSRFQHKPSWQTGIVQGGKVLSEIAMYQGMVAQILEESSSIKISSKKIDHVITCAQQLHNALNNPTNLLDISTSSFCNHIEDLDERLNLIRSKGKKLLSLLDMHNITQTVEKISF